MADKCVFFDRDNTIIEDPGYITDPHAVRLLPGADLALRSLAAEGYKLVIVSNQSAIARGMLTEEGLERIHGELRRQLEEKGVFLDGIYFCPFHPQGTVEAYAHESADRKPQPGMMLRAASELGLDLNKSWLVGDSPRDIEAGQRAGCRTIRVRLRNEGGAEADEDVQADYTVRNLVDAARVILQEASVGITSAAGESAARGVRPAGAAGASTAAGQAASGEPPIPPQPPAEHPDGEPHAMSVTTGPDSAESMTDAQVLREILRQLRQFNAHHNTSEFSSSRLVGAIFQMFALLLLAAGLVYMLGLSSGDYASHPVVMMMMTTSGVLQLTALTFFVLSRQR